MQELQTSGWLDNRTALVAIEYTVYNPDANTYVFTSITCEQTLNGKLYCLGQLLPFKMLALLHD